ncbi:aromatic acid exporter family protein, partial [Clostridium sp.]|uniref:aromatic acid exporter family protein n=1 Tax=Clostridium sp. TaxID=1506 RepID=UPI0034641522
MKIGMRIVKTSIAVFFSIVVSRMLGLGSGFFASIAAVISMESSIIYSFRAGINRIIGTILGASVGLTFALISPGNPFLAAIGIFIVISLCKYYKWNKAITISTTVFCAIMVNLDGRDPFLYASHRVIETFIGIIIALIVNYSIKPPNHNRKIEIQYKKIKNILLIIIEDFILNHDKEDLSGARAEILKFETMLKIYEDEILIS